MACGDSTWNEHELQELMSQNTANDRLLSIRQVAERLGLSTRAVYRLCAKGEFPKPVKLGGATRFYESDLQSFLERLKSRRLR